MGQCGPGDPSAPSPWGSDGGLCEDCIPAAEGAAHVSRGPIKSRKKGKGPGSADQGRGGEDAQARRWQTGCPSRRPNCRVSGRSHPIPELHSCGAQPPSISCVTEEGTQPQRGPRRLTCCRRQQLRPEHH